MADYTYDPSDGRYYDADGHAVPRKTILALLATLTAAQAAQFRALAQQRADDVLDTAAWHAEMADTVQTGVIAGAALAAGGVAQLDQAWTAGRIAQQLDYLVGFVAAVRDGAVAVTQPAADGEGDEAASGFLARAELYAGETHSAFFATDRERAIERGDDECMNELDEGSNSCAECEDATAQGWVPIEDMSEPGSRECQQNCRCVIVTRNSADVAEEAAV